jgi:peptidoglycan/xylan/chitin deacetylase (PgdA/CDA1 family)
MTIDLRNGGKSLSRISRGQYGARAGVPRILKVLDQHAVPATFFMPAVSAMLYPDEARAVTQAGHEIGLHSWIHEYNSNLDHDNERDLALRARDVLARLSGQTPVGMRTASWDFSPWTLKIIREMGLLYDSSLMADDEPYDLVDQGEPTAIVELPVEWIRDDAVYFNMDRATSLRPYVHWHPLSQRNRPQWSHWPGPDRDIASSLHARTHLSALGHSRRIEQTRRTIRAESPGDPVLLRPGPRARNRLMRCNKNVRVVPFASS